MTIDTMITETGEYLGAPITRRLGDYSSITFRDNQIILDVTGIEPFSRKRIEETATKLRDLFQHDEKVTPSRSWTEKIKFIKKRNVTPLLFRDIVVVTRINGEVQAISQYQVEGDIKYTGTKPYTGKNEELFEQIHQALVIAYLKSWREEVKRYGKQIKELTKLITQAQVASSALGVLTYLAGLVNNTPRYQLLSIVSIIVAAVMTIIKKTI